MNKAFFYSLLFHVIMLTILIVSFELSGQMPVLQNSKENNHIINAVVLDSSRIEAPKPAALQKPKPTIKPAPKIKKTVQEIIAKPKAIAIPDQTKKRAQIEKQLSSEIKKQADNLKKAKQKALEKAFEKEMKETAEKSLQQQLLSENNRVASARAAKMQGIVDKYKALILQAISHHWLVPANANKSLSTQLLIRLGPSGSVLDVQLVKSSGDDGLDRSARAAVFKASPLPVPENSDEFEPFRQFILKVKPENVLVQDHGLG